MFSQMETGQILLLIIPWSNSPKTPGYLSHLHRKYDRNLLFLHISSAGKVGSHQKTDSRRFYLLQQEPENFRQNSQYISASILFFLLFCRPEPEYKDCAW